MKRIKLTRGKYAMVDNDDFEFLNQWNWRALKVKNGFYAVRSNNKTNSRLILMHRQILNLKPGDGKMVDHKDRNGLNCRKSNLRLSTYSQNSKNRTPHGTSKYLGVSWDKSRKKWVAQIVNNKKVIRLGRFSSEIKAAKAYDAAAIKYHKEFSNINFKTKSK